MPVTRILLVDDENAMLVALGRVLARSRFEVIPAHNGAEALDLLRHEAVDVVISDIQMPGIDGIELVRQIREQEPDMPCVVMTAFSSGERSLEALHAGAFWYLEKSAPDLGALVRRLVEEAVESRRLRVENRVLKSELRTLTGRREIVGRSAAFRNVLAQVERVADTDSTVIITGESGTGKEVIARAIHESGRRASKIMVSVNCAALPDDLLDSELFGHVRGAFTHAVTSRQGRLMLADGGTLFLDEIGEMTPRLQTKLLRVLQERCFEPVGSSTTVRVDVRIIAATNQDLAAAMREKRFREDLYYRLAVIPIALPRLSARSEDVVLLVDHFLAQKTTALGGPIPALGLGVLDCLIRYDWPGNVRELENVIERLVVFARGETIEMASLPESIGAPKAVSGASTHTLPEEGLDLETALRDVETDLIVQALERTHWNKKRAADLLHVSRPALFTKIQRAGLSRPAPVEETSEGGAA